MKVCSKPGCPELVTGGRCAAHQSKRRRWVDEQRGTAAERGYDARWRRVRDRYLRSHPICEHVAADGTPCTEPATDVDHIVRRTMFAERRAADDPSNLQALCHPHHSAKTVAEDGGFGRDRAY